MKKAIMNAVFIGFSIAAHAQLTYSYDASGNRIKATVPNSSSRDDQSVVLNKIKTSNQNNSINVYPNPFTNLIQLHGDSKLVYTYTITDITGKELIVKHNIELPYSIDLSDLKIGLYFIQLSSGTETYTQKLIKE